MTKTKGVDCHSLLHGCASNDHLHGSHCFILRYLLPTHLDNNPSVWHVLSSIYWWKFPIIIVSMQYFGRLYLHLFTSLRCFCPLVFSFDKKCQYCRHIRIKACYMYSINNDLTHWGRDKIAAVSQTALSNAFSWTKISEFRLQFHWNLFLGVQLTVFQHWFR